MNKYLTLVGIVLAVLVALYVLNSMNSGMMSVVNVPQSATEAQEAQVDGTMNENYNNKKAELREKMTTGYRYDAGHPAPYQGSSSSVGGDAALSSTQVGCPTTAHLRPEDLLPQDDSSSWARMYPTGTGSLAGKNHLQAGALIGIDTVGQTLRNANLQLRSEPANPRVMVSPWLNSTIESDTNRRPFELGQC